MIRNFLSIKAKQNAYLMKLSLTKDCEKVLWDKARYLVKSQIDIARKWTVVINNYNIRFY
jgi:hypothetical protein